MIRTISDEQVEKCCLVREESGPQFLSQRAFRCTVMQVVAVGGDLDTTASQVVEEVAERNHRTPSS
jgi:hypothetical protein